MKIFDEKSGMKKVYVCKDNVILLREMIKSDNNVGSNNVINGINTKNNKVEFIEFKEPKMVELFESLDWILDFKELMNLSEEELSLRTEEVVYELNQLLILPKKINFTDKNRKNYIKLLGVSFSKMQTYEDILAIKQGRKEISFSNVSNDGLLLFDGDTICELKKII